MLLRFRDAPWRGAAVASAVVALASLAGAHEQTLARALTAEPVPATPASPAGLTSAVPAQAKLTLDVTIEGSPTPVAALVRITEVKTGQRIPLPAHLRRPMGWASLPPGQPIDVPSGALRIEVCHGLETELAALTHTIAADATASRLRIVLRRFSDLAADGLLGANTHLHLQVNAPRALGGALLRDRAEAETYLTATAAADALDLVYVSHLERRGETQNYVSNEFTREDLARFSTTQQRFANGEEHRHEGGRSTRRGNPDELRYGHVLFLDLPRLVEPVSYGGIFTPAAAPSDARPMRAAIAAAQAQSATVVWCHGKSGTEAVPNWVAGLLHAQNIFDGGSEGTFETVFYPYFNAGFRVPLSTGTDWGVYDFSRVYAPSPRGSGSAGFLRALAAGRTFITNGPLLELDVESKRPGDTLALAQPILVRVRLRAIGRDDFVRLELIWNGYVVQQLPSRKKDGHFLATFETSLEIAEPGWFAVRVVPSRPYNDRSEYSGAGANLFGKALFAHTSPIYVTLEGRTIQQADAVRTLITEIENSMATIREKGAFASDTERESLLTLYREALAELNRRLAK